MEMSPFEHLVREGLIETAAREWAIVPETPAYSTHYRSWEQKLLTAPFRYGRRRSRPVWIKAVQAAACVILTLSVAFGGVMAVSPGARAWVAQIFAEWFGDYARFTFSGNAGQETGVWRTEYLPEGFELVDQKTINAIEQVTYKNQAGTRLVLNYMPGDGNSFGTDNEHQVQTEVSIHGNTGYLLCSDTPGKPSYLVWSDPAAGTAFRLVATLDSEELIKIAENIVLQP